MQTVLLFMCIMCNIILFTFYSLGFMVLLLIWTLCPEKVSPPKDFATTCVSLHQIKYNFTHTATCISNDVIKFLKNNSYSDSEIKL